jgi:hypothetical protein
MTTRTEEIKSAALRILKSNSSGMRYSDLVRKIEEELPHIPVNTIHGNIWNLEVRLPKEVYKPARGVFRHVIFREEEIREEQKPSTEVERIKEEAFYKPFADWLVNETEECTKAIPLGRNKFKDKWGTPDVIGKRAPRASDIIKFPTEIVSAELKTDTKELITAFGQACSYKLFSHKSYLIIPRNSPEADISRLDALCLIFGIGLVLFDSSNPNEPQFDIKVRPLKHDPDMFYVNENMKWIEDELFE